MHVTVDSFHLIFMENQFAKELKFMPGLITLKTPNSVSA